MDLKALRKQNICETKEKLASLPHEHYLLKELHFFEEINRSLIAISSKGEDAELIGALQNAKDRAKKKVNALALSVAPKTAELLGGILAAKMIDAAGSLQKLASIPSSKIQLLGAEKALFRHLREGAKSPKYGLIFLHPSVQKAENKGKAARELANEIAKVARIDFFSKKREVL